MLPVVLLLLVVFGVLLWQRFHPYIVTRPQMVAALERALAQQMPAVEWLRLAHKPIKRDRYLETLRARLAQVPTKGDADSGPLHSPAALQELAHLLAELKSKRLE